MPSLPLIPPDTGISAHTHIPSKNENQNTNKKLPNIPPKTKESWRLAQIEANEDINNISKWDSLFETLDQRWQQILGSDDSTQREQFKSAAYLCYYTLLQRFPYLAAYWRRLLVFSYKLDGLNKSLEVLRLSVLEYPQSVSLWTEYLTALTNEGAGQEETYILEEFERGRSQVGFNYSSDPFWNLYIAYISNKEPSKVLDLYLQVVKVPLYQYAIYYNQFTELIKNYDINDVIKDQSNLQKPLNELSPAEKQQALDEFAYSIFINTQTQVNEKWAYESRLDVQEFSLSNLAYTENQFPAWNNYLDYELGKISSLSGEDKRQQVQIAQNLFERSIVPMCFDERLWIKFIDFSVEHLSPQETKSIFERAVFRFVPLDSPKIRDTYQTWLLEHENFELCNGYLLDLIHAFSGSSSSYFKGPFLHEINQILNLWHDKLSDKEFQGTLKSLVSSYFDRVDRYKKEETNEYEDEEHKHHLARDSITLLLKALNNDAICVITVKYLRCLNPTDDKVVIRKFYNTYYRETPFQRSVQFWKFFVNFEGKTHINFANLRSIIDHIKSKSSLPKKAVDAFLDLYLEIVKDNLPRAVQAEGLNGEEIHDILVTHELEKSNLLGVNGSARGRLLANNPDLLPKEDRKSDSFNDENHYSPSETIDDSFKKLLLSHAAHPGIFHKLPQMPKHVASDQDNMKALKMTLKNFEKVKGAPVNYPDE